MGHTFDFVAVGDTVSDAFITLEDATVNCDVNTEQCTISMRWGDKIPYRDLTLVHGVGNSANAAVAASRLGLKSALVSNIGSDEFGKEVLKNFKRERVDTRYVKAHRGAKTNYHFVLSYEAERTILVKHEHYDYALPKGIEKARALYLSSLGNGTEDYHDALADMLEKNPDIFLAFQPGTFQIKLGAERLARIFRRSNLFFANKEEYQRILGLPETHDDIPDLLRRIATLGVKIPVLTDGRNGAYALENNEIISVPMFPDPAPPVERTGAGDAFSSTTTAYALLGLPLKEAMVRGTINSAYVVQKIGAQAGLLTKKDLETKVF